MIGAIILGFFAGVIGRLLMPGDVFRHMSGPASWATSLVLGLVGAWVGWLLFTGLLGIGDDDIFDLGGILSAIIGVLIVLPIAGFVLRLFRPLARAHGRRAGRLSTAARGADRFRGVKLTHIGGPTALIELGGWTLLTDPTFDAPGGHYNFGWGRRRTRSPAPRSRPGDLPPIDAVLLSHDHHEDNLDAGRARAAAGRRRRRHHRVGREAARRRRPRAARLGGDAARGARARPTMEIIATPCRHGPPLSHPIVGDVIGFTLIGRSGRVVWISGRHRALRRRARGGGPVGDRRRARCTSAACSSRSPGPRATR